METLQANTTESEVALARSNPRAFYQAQVCAFHLFQVNGAALKWNSAVV